MAKLGKDPELNALMKKVNKRITVLERSYNVIYQNQTDALIDRMRRTAEHLTGSEGRTIRKGNLRPEDVNKYKRAMRSFLESDMSTVTGQNRIMAKARAAFESEYGEISEADYVNLTKIMESDQFAMFKEKYGMYGNIVKDMVATRMDYEEAILFLQEALDDPETYSYADGSLNVGKFIEDWQSAAGK